MIRPVRLSRAGRSWLSARNTSIAAKHVSKAGWIAPPKRRTLFTSTIPGQSGDVLLIASEGQGANKIIPTLTYEWKDNPQGFDPKLNPIGATNLQLKTSNGYSPHLFPEYITEWSYYYAGAPRPGFMSRFLVAENGTRAPYWPTSPNSFGGQVNASYNGDLPGDIYRFDRRSRTAASQRIPGLRRLPGQRIPAAERDQQQSCDRSRIRGTRRPPPDRSRASSWLARARA